MIPESIRNLFKRRTVGRLSPIRGPYRVTLELEAALNDLKPGEIMELTGRETGRQYVVVMREDLEHVLTIAGLSERK
jgi:hypothetical protein